MTENCEVARDEALEKPILLSISPSGHSSAHHALGGDGSANGNWFPTTLLVLPSLVLAILTVTAADGSESAGDQVRVEFPTNVQMKVVDAQWTEQFAELNGINVSYYHSVPSTSGRPKLIYYHGGGTDGSEGVAMFSTFVSEFEIFCPSARGFGPTSQGTEPSTTAQMVLDAIALLPIVDPTTEKVFMAAHSMGATVAPRVAKEHPEYVAGLVLEDPAWLRNEGEPESANAEGTAPAMGDSLSNESVEDIQVPALILMAEFGDGVPAVLDAALATYPQGSKYFFPNATHCIHCDYLDAYRQVVQDYFFSLLRTG